MGYSPWGRKELDMTEETWHAHTYLANMSPIKVPSQHLSVSQTVIKLTVLLIK